MNEKTYIYKSVTYGYSKIFRKWRFICGSIDYLSDCKDGAETAHKIARIVNGSFTRCRSLDNLARANIFQVNS